jgi:excisionase family DNA binding protein
MCKPELSPGGNIMTQHSGNSPGYLDAEELAPHLRVSKATVLAWARRGWIPCLRIGQRHVLFNLAEVEAALRQRSRKPSQA